MSAVILRKQQGQAIPSDVIEKIVADFPGAWGASYVEDGELQIGSEQEGATAELVDETQTNLLEEHAVFFFSKERDEQPYPLFTTVQEMEDDEGNKANVEVSLISCYLEGNFKVRRKDGTEHQHLPTIAEYIRKKVKMYMAVHEDDVTKAIAQIREDENDFLNLIQDRGVIMIVANDGDVCTIAKNNMAGAFEWGWMSNHLGFRNEEAQPQGTAAKVKGMFSKAKHAIAGKSGNAPPPPAPKEEKQTAVHNDPPPVPKEEPKTETAVPVNAGIPKDVATEMVWWRPTSGMTRSQKKSKYKALNQNLSSINWKDNSPVMVPLSLKEKMSSSFGGEWLDQAAAEKLLQQKFPPQHEKPKAEVGTKLSGKTTKDGKPLGEGVHEVSQPVKEKKEEKPVTAEILPVLGPKALKAAVEGEALKTLDTHSVETPDTATLQTLERKYPPVMKQLGKSEDTWLKWDYQGIRQLNDAHPDILPILICDARLTLWRQAQTIADLQKEIAKLKGDQHVAPTATTSVPNSKAPPTKKHKFGQGYKKTG